MRLNRYISVCGAASRRKGEVIIREGRVAVNSEIVTDPARNIEPGKDRVTLDGLTLAINPENRYFILNKPTGTIVSRGDTHGRATVMDLMGVETGGVFPVGRLDADTSGVLLLTDDGDLTHKLTHPSFGVEKVYRVEVEGKVVSDDVRKLWDGLVLDDGPTAPAEMKILERDDKSSLVEITIHQGRKRQVRRMMKHIGHPVKTLERISFGGITAQGLPPGAYRALDTDEVELLKKAVKQNSGEES